MQIATGLFDRMVLQRGVPHTVTLATPARGDVFQRVGRGWKNVGRAPRFTLAPLPVGGPHTIALEIREAGRTTHRLTVRDVLVGDVWIAAGQSNMQGYGRREFAAKPHPFVRAFYMDDQWRVARDPIHNLDACVDQVHLDLNGGVRYAPNTTHGVGPAVAFAQEMRRLTGVPQGIIACAHGGTSMTQWDPARRDEGGKSLYGATYRRLQKNGGHLAGVIWYQGESDANASDAPHYTARMKALIAAFRRDAGDPRLPFVLVQLARVTNLDDAAGAHWNAIQSQQLQLQQRLPRVAVVPAVDLTLDDPIHIGGASMDRLGRRLANAMHALRTGRGPLPILPGRHRVRTDRGTGQAILEIPFHNVAGRLVSGSRPTGFRVSGNSAVTVVDVRLVGVTAHVLLSAKPLHVTGAKIQYGRGADPYCNITDEADRALPVFGPILVGKPRALTPLVRRFEISDLLPGDDLTEYPASLGWQTREFAGDLADRHVEFGATNEPRRAYYRIRLRADEPMQLSLLLGYDGPVKVWLDRREVFSDPHGTNPAVPDAKRIRFAAHGEHEIVVGLSTNTGRAWGIFVRFERHNVPARLLADESRPCTMPVIL